MKSVGSVVGNFITDDHSDWITELHIVDRRYTGRFDGYLGFDFLKKHRAIIDLHNGILKLHSSEEDDKKKKKVTFATNEKTIIDDSNDTDEQQLNHVADKSPTPIEVNVILRNENEEINKTISNNKQQENEISNIESENESENEIEYENESENEYEEENEIIEIQQSNQFNQSNENILSNESQIVSSIESVESTPYSSRGQKMGFEFPKINIINALTESEHNSPSDLYFQRCYTPPEDLNCSQCCLNFHKIREKFKLKDPSHKYLYHIRFSSTDLLRASEYEDFVMNDDDDEVTKLRKISNYKLLLPKEVRNYAAYFQESSPKQVPINTIEIIDPPSRTDLIINKLPMQNRSPEEIAKIQNLVHRFPYQFYVEGDVLSKTDVIQHYIHLNPGAPIVNKKQFPLSHKMRQEVIHETNNLWDQRIIEPSTSPYNSPAFMVPKKNEFGDKTDTRFVIDYKGVNDHTQLIDYPIPRIEQLIDNFAKCKFFSTLDIKEAFHQIEVYEPHRPITAFTAGYNKFQWNRMPFGLCTAPFTMQKAITTALMDLLGNGVSVYIDDVTIAAETIEEHDQLLEEVFTRLKNANFQVKIPKCQMYTKQLEYLGYIITPGEIRPNPKKVEAILRLKSPRKRKDLQSFLGMFNHYRKFIPKYAEITRVLSEMTSVNLKFQWSQECEDAFNQAKMTLANDVPLKIVNYDERFYISTDASGKAISATLSQGKPPDDRPIQYFSKSLPPAQQKWSAHERECLALVSAVKAFAPYLHGREFTLITDNYALVYLAKLKDPYNKLFRMRMELLNYNYKIVHRPGKLNQVADALSRLEFDEEMDLQEYLSKFSNQAPIENEELNTKQIRAITRQQTAAATTMKPEPPPNTTVYEPFISHHPDIATQDSEYDCIFSVISEKNKRLLTLLTNDSEFEQTNGLIKLHDTHYIATLNKPTAEQNELRKIIDSISTTCKDNEFHSIAINTDVRAKHLFIMKFLLNNCLKDQNIHVSLHTNQVVELTDPREIKNALDMHHKTRLGAHNGIHRMANSMKRVYKWRSMMTDIKNYVMECPICEKSKITTHTRAPLQITATGEKAFDHVYIDYMGPVTPSEEGYKYIFVATCDLTKFSVAIPTMDHTAATTAGVFLEHIILKYGFPSMVSHDQGTEFMNEIFEKLNDDLKIKQISTTPYHPSSNIVERQNRNTNQYLRCYIDEKPQIWAKLLPYATFAYNITIHTSTGYAPFHLLYGREVTLPDSITKKRPIYTYDNYVDVMLREMHDAWSLAQQRIVNAKIINKEYYDRKMNNPSLQVGDHVLLRNEVKDHKFDKCYAGPYQIIEIPSDQYLVIEVNNKPKRVHRNRIKKSRATGAASPDPDDIIINLINCFY